MGQSPGAVQVIRPGARTYRGAAAARSPGKVPGRPDERQGLAPHPRQGCESRNLPRPGFEPQRPEGGGPDRPSPSHFRAQGMRDQPIEQETAEAPGPAGRPSHEPRKDRLPASTSAPRPVAHIAGIRMRCRAPGQSRKQVGKTDRGVQDQVHGRAENANWPGRARPRSGAFSPKRLALLRGPRAKTDPGPPSPKKEKASMMSREGKPAANSRGPGPAQACAGRGRRKVVNLPLVRSVHTPPEHR